MLEWWQTVPAGLAAFAMLVLPGVPATYLAGLRGVLAWAAAPLLSGFAIAVGSTIGGELGVRWGWAALLAATAVTALIAWLARALAGGWVGPRHIAAPSRRRPATVGVVVVGAAVALIELRRQMMAIAAPGNISQTFDNIFHLGSVALMLDTGNASSLSMNLSAAPDATVYYPGLWHAVTAFVAQVTGTGVPVAANWVTLGISTVVWPLSLFFLARVVFGPRPLVLMLTVGLAFSMTQFPTRMFTFGVLYPNLYSYALMPAVIGLVVLALRGARGRGRIAPMALVGAGLITLVFAHPNAIFGIGYAVVPLLVWLVARYGRRAWRKRRYVMAVGVWPALVVLIVAVYVGVGQISLVAAFREQSSWVPFGRVRTALWAALTLSAASPGGKGNYLMAALVVVGLVVCAIVARWRWLGVAYLWFIVLFVIARSWPDPWLRELLTGYWYTDQQRLAAQLPILAVPIAALGGTAIALAVARLITAVTRSARRWQPRRAVRAPAVAVTVAVALVGVVAIIMPRTPAIRAAYEAVTEAHSFDPTSVDSTELVSQEEKRVLTKVATVVPEGVSVAGDPWDGSSMTWSMANRVAVIPHTAFYASPDRVLVRAHLRDALTMPEVCDAVRRLDLGYVLRFGRHIWGNPGGGFSGLDDLVENGVGELVMRDGAASLYRITACGPIGD